MPCFSARQPAVRLALAVTLYTCIATLPSASAQTTQQAPGEASIQALLNKLASDDWAERHEAQARLAAMAEVAEPQLRKAAHDSDDAEVRTRCHAALAQIYDNRLIGPTLITLESTAIDPQTACAELARQLDVTLELRDRTLWDRGIPKLAIIADRKPLWDVVRELRTQCGLDLEPAGSNRLAIVVVPEAQRATQTSTHGPFRVRAARITRSAAIDLTGLVGAGAGASSEFTITVNVQAEPKLSVARGSRLARLELAEDENGVSLLPAEGGPVFPVNRVSAGDTMRPGTAWWPAMGRLQYPAAGAGKRIARLKGSASCALLVHAETIEIPNVVNVQNVVKEVGGTQLTIKAARRVGACYEVQVSGPRAFAGLEAMQGFRGQPATTEGARLLLMPQGTELPLQGRRASMTPQGVDVTFRFGAANAPADAEVKLLWQVATDVRNVEIPFEFTDLPLP